MIVVADTSPLRYLILIEHIHVLPALYGRVVVPPAVVTELDQEHTPSLVRLWLSARPEWLQIQAPRQDLSSLRDVLGPGEREAIALAEELSADAVLIDDRDGRREAEGTLPSWERSACSPTPQSTASRTSAWLWIASG